MSAPHPLSKTPHILVRRGKSSPRRRGAVAGSTCVERDAGRAHLNSEASTGPRGKGRHAGGAPSAFPPALRPQLPVRGGWPGGDHWSPRYMHQLRSSRWRTSALALLYWGAAAVATLEIFTCRAACPRPPGRSRSPPQSHSPPRWSGKQYSLQLPHRGRPQRRQQRRAYGPRLTTSIKPAASAA